MAQVPNEQTGNQTHSALFAIAQESGSERIKNNYVTKNSFAFVASYRVIFSRFIVLLEDTSPRYLPGKYSRLCNYDASRKYRASAAELNP